MALYNFQRRGMLYVISAPSGGGKSVVVQQLLATMPGLTYSVSVTSRPMRPGEVDGREYQFVKREEFEQMIRDDLFYEWAEVHGNFYGTRESTVREALDRGTDVLLDIDIQGGMSVKWRSPDAVLLFLMPPSMEILEQRLRARKTDSDEQIRIRLENARREMDFWRFYDFVVVNDVLEQTVQSAKNILEAERHRARRLRQFEK
ncbi:guanylate kinase [bacterium]|nr:guanylate kinase [bacterium]